mmetsp:Transcript_4821/g.5578  ORF Transcript_4821/g.5578 Transcript_4821/m.5578 type:complete len:94 (+) Transcript_4821:48-329(+)
MRIKITRFLSMILLTSNIFRGLANQTRYRFPHRLRRENTGLNKNASQLKKASLITTTSQRKLLSTKRSNPPLFGIDQRNFPRAVFFYDGGCGV